MERLLPDQFHRNQGKQSPPNEHTETFSIEDMRCEHCVASVREALEGLEGVTVEDVEIGSARVRYDADRTDRTRIAHAIEEAGYAVPAAKGVKPW